MTMHYSVTIVIVFICLQTGIGNLNELGHAFICLFTGRLTSPLKTSHVHVKLLNIHLKLVGKNTQMKPLFTGFCRPHERESTNWDSLQRRAVTQVADKSGLRRTQLMNSDTNIHLLDR